LRRRECLLAITGNEEREAGARKTAFQEVDVVVIVLDI